MPVYKIGYLIKQRRTELMLTQEELADGICSVTTLSRIENEERLPTKNHFEMLFQRLGLSDIIFYTYADENTLYLHEQKFKIRNAVLHGQYNEARELLNDYSSKADMSSPHEQQFVLLYSTLSLKEDYSVEERLSRLQDALYLSCPKYREGVLPKLFSYEEIIILNNIAICNSEIGDLDEAISILYHIKQHYERGIVNQEEVLRTQTMVLYNLSKYLGLAERYDECIDVCDLGIQISRDTGRCGCLSQLLYNLAWALTKRMLPGDMEQAQEAARNAVYAAAAIGDKLAEKRYKEFFVRNFPKARLLLDFDRGGIT